MNPQYVATDGSCQCSMISNNVVHGGDIPTNEFGIVRKSSGHIKSTTQSDESSKEGPHAQ